MYLKLSSAKRWPFCSTLNVLFRINKQTSAARRLQVPSLCSVLSGLLYPEPSNFKVKTSIVCCLTSVEVACLREADKHLVGPNARLNTRDRNNDFPVIAHCHSETSLFTWNAPSSPLSNRFCTVKSARLYCELWVTQRIAIFEPINESHFTRACNQQLLQKGIERTLSCILESANSIFCVYLKRSITQET